MKGVYEKRGKIGAGRMLIGCRKKKGQERKGSEVEGGDVYN